MLPRARAKDLVVEKLDDETLVYDLRNNQAHCLNSTASLVWMYCDGKTDLAGITRKISVKMSQPVNQDVVQLALQNLTKAHLLDENATAGSGAARVSRRDLIKTIGKTAAITLPLVTSIVAPEAAQAASCVPKTTCTSFVSRNPNPNKGSCCCSYPQGHPGTVSSPHSTCQPAGAPPNAPYICSANAPGC